MGPFSYYRHIQNFNLPLDSDTGRKRNSAFIYLTNKSEFRNAIGDLLNIEWIKHRLSLNQLELYKEVRDLFGIDMCIVYG
ncbi:hypothetical protein [Prochlorococcus sp. MIT 1307]|uniref:hypothetical protein n=1 Tax=Prochlorococcus sp. MIT 1307 TaxID=3096219 RepID=UPI002A760EB9|nr:hypothetical protein [Prochlorococcus sp. MIT 1307]